MKLTRLMLSASIAALALVSCNKNDVTPEVGGNSPKTVEISFENIVLTKGAAGDKINHNSPVKVNNLKIFLTDEAYSTSYNAWNENQKETAKFFWSAEDLTAGMPEAAFHYVDHKCNRVIAVANMGDLTFDALKAFTEEIADQQDQNGLILLDYANLVKTSDTHTAADGKSTEIYEAELMLAPAISRFELDGFSVTFGATPVYDEVEVIDVAFTHYYPTVAYSTTSGNPAWLPTGDHVNPVLDYANAALVYEWLGKETTTGWYRDSYTDQVVMTPDDPATPAFENKADVPSPRAYHFFSGDVVPTMVIRLLVDGNPAYVFTDTFKDASGTAITKLDAGKIYRMSAAGVASNSGTVDIPEEVIDPMARCLDITVDVIDWQVELVTPEF